MSTETMKKAIKFAKQLSHRPADYLCAEDWEALSSLQEALDKQEQGEPVVYCEIHLLTEPCVQCTKEHEGYNAHSKQGQGEPVAIVAVGGVTNKIDVGWLRMPKHNDKLYTTPPQRTWVGLTDDDVDYIADEYSSLQGAIRAIEARLKEKNYD